jgi:type IV pilus assembly protein PilB
MAKKRLGEILLAEGIITPEQLDIALSKQKELGLKLGEYLEKEGILTEEALIQALNKQLNIKFVDLLHMHVTEDIINMIPEEIARKNQVLPIAIENGKIVVAMKDPLDYFATEEIRVLVGLKVIPVMAYRENLDQAIKKYYGRSTSEKALSDFVKNKPKQTKSEVDVIEKENAPIINFVDSVIENAIRNKASDIHIEPDEDELRIRFRIDGVLRQYISTDIETTQLVVSRIKIMSNLKITERRKPQDGRAVYEIDGRRVDLRISTLPVGNYEKVVIRILDKKSFNLERKNLGFTQYANEKYEEMKSKPNGIIIVTGPTGSGKTTTLYTMLSELNSIEKNIVTVEDPIEFHFKGMNQVQINPSVGLNFADGLRSILRQDPDIVMIGEIRDKETAEIAVRAALTGHLVLTTLHTNDSISTISRMVDMGVEPFLLSTTLSGIISQRLVRKACPNCKKEYEASSGEKKLLGVSEENSLMLVKGSGCELCSNTGYNGRKALFEMLSVDKHIKSLVESGAKYSELNKYVEEEKIPTLKSYAVDLVLNKETTIEELLRVTYL